MRVLLASTAGAGHLGPLLPFARALQQAHHEVEFVVPEGVDPSVDEGGWRVTRGGAPPSREMDRLWRRFAVASAAEARRIAEREAFATRCTEAMLPALAQIAAARSPDLILREPCEYASAITAVQLGIPLGTVAITRAGAEWSVLELVADILDGHEPGVRETIAAAPFLTRFPASVDPSPFPRTMRYREATGLGSGAAGTDPWQGRPHPHLYLTFGSRVGGSALAPPLFRAALEELSGVRAQVLFTLGREFDASSLPPAPENLRLRSWVDQEQVLGDCDAVLCHGGSGTTLAALAHGLPLGFIPLFADQGANANWVVGAGAGLLWSSPATGRLPAPTEMPDAGAIRAMVEALLEEQSLRAAARRLGRELSAQPGVAALVEELASGVDPPR